MGHASWVTVVPDTADPEISRVLLHCGCGWAELLGSEMSLDVLNVLSDRHQALEYRAVL